MSTRVNTRPTISDVARACGVSEATVSYVINGKRTLRTDTRDKVFRAMREMNYHPSAVARGLSSKKVHTFGILHGAVDAIESVTNYYSSGLLQGIMPCAQREAFDITFFTATWVNAEASAPALRDGRTDGILAIAPPTNSDITAGLVSLNVPLVMISGDANAGVANVDVDNSAGITAALEHLFALGHRKIAFLMGNENLSSFGPRRDAFHAVHWQAAIDVVPEWVQVSRFDGALAYEQTRTMLALADRPTAICAGNDTIALRVIEAARAAGLEVPRDLSVVGFDDSPAALLVSPNLTTVRQPLAEIGNTATQMLIEYMRQPEEFVPKVKLLQPELIVRGSTAPPA
jgi:LacI family transcriptional regulator